jgi:glutaredoxin 2
MTGPTIGQQLDAMLSNLATKQDLERFATKEDLERFATKEDIKNFATKEDLKSFATREELYAVVRAAIKELVQVINQNTEDLREDLNEAGIKIRTKVRNRSGYSAE